MKAGPLQEFLHMQDLSQSKELGDKGQDVNRQVKMSDISNIGVALNDGWAITFPRHNNTI